MVTRDRAENRDGPKVRGERGGGRNRSGLGTWALTPWIKGEDGDAGLKGERCPGWGGSKEPGAGEEAAKFDEERDRVRAGPA